MASIHLKPERFHGEWNYVIYPAKQVVNKLLKQLRRSIEKLEDHERNEILKGLKASTAA